MSMQNQHSKRPKCALGHTRLEPRRLLNADFDLTGGTLDLDGFVDSTVDPNEVSLSQTGLVYSFELADGFWTGDDSAAGVTLLAGDSILEIDTSLESLTSIFMDSDGADSFDIVFGDFDFSGGLDITSTGVSFGDVSQLGGTSVLHTGTLSIDGAASITLTEAGNDFDMVSIVDTTSVSLNDATGVSVLALASTADTTITAAGPIDLAAVDVDGSLDVSTSVGDITQSSALDVEMASSFSATAGTVCLTDAANDFSSPVTATGSTVELVDANDLEIASVSATDDIYLRSGATGAGALTITGDLVTVGGQVLLQSDSGVTQAGGSTISASELLIGGDLADEGTGAFDLVGTNMVGAVASDIVGELHFINDVALDVTSLSYASVCGTAESIVGVAATDKVRLDAAGITITEPIASTMVFLESSAGVTQGVLGTITADDLMLSGDGVFDLSNSGNDTVDWAASITGSLSYADATSVNVAELTCDGVTIAGISVSDDLTIDTTATDGDITQDATAPVVIGLDGSATFLAGLGDVCLTNASNDFDDPVTATGSTVELVDANALEIASVTAVDDIYLRSGATGAGALTITGDLVTVGGQVLLQSDSGVTQAGGSTISASELLLGGDLADEGTGTFDLVGTNMVGAVAADIVGELHFINDVALDVTSLSYASVCGTAESIVGVAATDKVRLDAAGITITEPIASTVVFLESSAGVTQSVLGTITADDLMLSGDGAFDLSNSGNDIVDLAASITGSLSYADATGVNVAELTCDGVTIIGIDVSMELTIDTTATGGDITQDAAALVVAAGLTVLDAGAGDICLTDPTNDFGGAVTATGSTIELVDRNAMSTGLISAVDDIFLRSGATDSGSLTLDGVVSTSAVDGQVLLQSDTGVTQTVGSLISTSELLLGGDAADEGSGDFVLTDANDVDFLAADLVDSLSFTNTTSLVVADLTYSSSCLTVEDICGIDVGGGLTLDVTGSLTQTAAVIVGAATDLTATIDICLTGGDCTGDGLNDNDFGGTVTAAAMVVEIVDANDLIVGDITADDNIFLRSGDNGVGGLTLDGDLTTTDPAGQVLLQSDSGAIQDALSTITASELLVGGDLADEGSGVFDLVGSNMVTALAVDVVGEIHFINSSLVVIDSLTYSSTCGTTEAITGASATDKVRVAADGITISELVVSDFVFLESTSGVTQGVSGSITTTDLMLSGSGLFALSNPLNDADRLAADITGTLDYYDASDLTIAELTCDLTTICGLTITDDLTLTTDNGDLTQAPDPSMPTVDSAAVIVGGDTVIDTGTGNICLTGGDCDGNGINENSFGGLLTVTSSGDVVIAEAGDISIDSVSGGGSYRFIGDNIQINTAITGTQLLLEASDGVDYNGNVIDVTDLMLSGTGVFDFGTSGDTANSIDNLAADIDGSLTLINGTALDIGDLVFVSDCGDVAICGVNIDIGGGASGSLDLSIVDADLTQSAAVTVEGATVLDAGAGDICLTGGDCTGDGLNDNDFVGEVTATASTVEIVDSNALSVGVISAVDDIFLRSGDNGAGGLSLGGVLTTSAGDGQVLLQSDGGVTQAVGATITTSELLLGGGDADEGSGDFVLTEANDVEFLAVDLEDGLSFTNTNSLVVGDLSYSSDCGTVEPICGVDVGGDLVLDITGSLTQSASVIVGGATDLTATVNICLTGGDCTGDGLNDNDFVGLVSATAETVEIVDANAMIVGDVSAVDNIFLRSGDNGSGALSLTGDLTTSSAGGQVLLQSDGGVTQSIGATIITNGLLLGGDDVDEGSGDFILTGSNDVNFLAADLEGTFSFSNTGSLEVADLAYSSVCGTDEAICGLEIGVDLTLDVIGSLTQAAAVIVGGTTDLTATDAICLLGGDCTGDGLNDNDFVGVVTATGSTVEIVDANGLIVGDVTATDDIFLRSGDNGVGSLSLTGDLVTTSPLGQVLLQSDSGVTQGVGGSITTSELILGGDTADEGSGDFVIGESNSVEFIAASLTDGLTFTNSISLEIADLEYASICETLEAICGIEIGGVLTLDVTGSLTQTAAVIVGGTADLTATDDICLTGADCSGDGLNDNDFMDVVTATAATVEIVDANDLVVGDIIAIDDIFLRSGDNGLGSLTLTGDLTASAADGQILLQSDSGATQAVGSVIATFDLLLGGDLADEGSGVFVLDGLNEAERLAADLTSSLIFVNAIDLEIADLTYSSDCGTTEAICGLDISGGLTLDVTGSLTQSAAVVVFATTDLTATGDICLTGGDCTGDGLNDNDFMGLVTATGATVEIVDANSLLVGDVTAVDDIFLRSGDNGVGALALVGDLTASAPDGQVLLQSDSGVTQAAGATITTSELLLGGDLADEGSGDFVLTEANLVDFIAADLEDDLRLENAASLTIADLSYASSCGTTEDMCGLDIGGLLVLDVSGDLTQTAAVIVAGTTELTVTDRICLTGGDCSGDGLNDNDFVGEVTATGTTVELVDSNDLLVGDISAVEDIFLRSGDNGVGALTLGGDLVTTGAAGQILLQSDSGVTQLGGETITTSELMLGGDDADEGSGDFVLDNANSVDRIAADLEDSLVFEDTTSLVVADLTYDSSCGTSESICGINIGGDLDLVVIGSLTQTASVIVGGETDLFASVDICLTGGDCTGDGENDNDFVGEVTAIAVTVEIVDANDLLVGDIIAVNNIFLRAGDNGMGAISLIGDLTNLDAEGEVLLQANLGVAQLATSEISTHELVLGGDDADERSGDFTLIGANEVDELAADLDASLTFVNATSLIVADLEYDSTCLTTEAICGLRIGVDLTLDITGDLTQTAAVIVGGETNLVATERICLTGGDCTGDLLNDNDFVGVVNAEAIVVEIVDANALVVGDVTAVDNAFLRSGDNGIGLLSLTGDVITTAADGQVLLQSDSGVAQDPITSTITTSELMVGGDDADEATGTFKLLGENVVSSLAGNLFDGSLQMINNANLLVESLTYASTCGTMEAFADLHVAGEDALDAEIVTEGQLAGTIQLDPVYNEAFVEYLTTDMGVISDIGIAIDNEGSFENDVAITSDVADIFIQTTVIDPMTTDDDITVDAAISVGENGNHILIVAGGELELNAALSRGTMGDVLSVSNINPTTISGLFLDGYIAQNPGPEGASNAQVDATDLNQDLTYIFGLLGELRFTTDVFWGIELGAFPLAGLVPDFPILDSLDAAGFAAFDSLLFGGFPAAGFESQSFYDDPFLGGISDTVTSQPINAMAGPESFTIEFLRDNPEFRSVLFVYNDANINIFESASDDLVDLNVAVEDFLGLARIGTPPVVEIQRMEFQIPQRVEITLTEEPDYFETILVDEIPVFIHTPPNKFFVVVYFESQFEADQFETRFELLDDDTSTRERDFDSVRSEILKKSNLDYIEWEAGDEGDAVDANQIREILERAILDLVEDDQDGDWMEQYKKWLGDQSGDRNQAPDVPRGVFKILEVENGKATIQGDDVDRRFVPEPEEGQGVEDYQFKNDDAENENDDHASLQPIPTEPSTRMARWSAMLSGETSDQVVVDVDSGVENQLAETTGRIATVAGGGIGMLAMLCHYNSKNNKSAADEIESLGEIKAKDPNRNVFSRASRFRRRNEFAIQDDES